MVRFACFFPFLFFLAACAANSFSPFELDKALTTKRAISLPMQMNEAGLIVLQDVRMGEQSYKFVVDTGATQSAIFEDSLKLFETELQANQETLVHGMTTSQKRQIVNVPKFELGTLSFLQKSLIVLPNRGFNFGENEPFDGLIGMDILSDYQIYVSPKTSEFVLIPNKYPVITPSHWDRIELIANPFQDDRRDLHFMEVRLVGSSNIAGLIDTGAEFSVMNWNSSRHSTLKFIKRKLKKDWELQGAVGTFEPISKVTLNGFRSGQKFWDHKDFIVMNFDSLDVLGVSDEPFVILGMNLFQNDTFFIDFERNYMSVEPTKVNKPKRKEPGELIIKLNDKQN